MEIWKDIKGYEGYYKASNTGKIKSLKRKKEAILKCRKDGRGYEIVDLYLNGRRDIKVHQLVAMAFLNHTPCGYKIVVDHISGDITDNSLNNLQLISQRENTAKNKKKGTSKYTGVSWSKGRSKWVASIQINGKAIFLGRFKEELEAHNAYQQALLSI